MQFTDPAKAITYIRGHFQHTHGFITLDSLEILLKYATGLRKDGTTPEWFHAVCVMLWLMNHSKTLEGIEYKVFCASLLHDTVEDHKVMLDVFKVKFPLDLDIMEAIRLLSKESIDRTKKSNADYYFDLSENEIASLVKGSDRVDNLRSMTKVFSDEKQRAYIADTREFVIPMLKRARKTFPRRRDVYEALKFTLNLACDLIEETLDAKGKGVPDGVSS